MEIPPPDPNKLLQTWMEWERGEVTPGRVMANLKTGGLPVLLEALVNRATGDGDEGRGGLSTDTLDGGTGTGEAAVRP